MASRDALLASEDSALGDERPKKARKKKKAAGKAETVLDRPRLALASQPAANGAFAHDDDEGSGVLQNISLEERAPASHRGRSERANNLPRAAAEIDDDDDETSGSDEELPARGKAKKAAKPKSRNAKAADVSGKHKPASPPPARARKPRAHRSLSPRGVRAPLYRELVGVGLFALALLSLLALVSYDATDPGFGVTGAGSVHNLIGPFGAYLADGLTLLFGLGGFVAPALLFFAGLFCFKPVLGRPQLWQVAGGAMLFLGVATFLDVVAGKTTSLPYPAGGLIGAVVGGAFVPFVHSLGAGILSLLCAGVGVNLLIARPLGHTVNDVAALLRLVYGYAREEIAIWWEKERLLREERERLYEELEEERRAREQAEAEPDEDREQRRREKAEERARREVAAEAERAEKEALAALHAASSNPSQVSTPPLSGEDPLWAQGGVTDPGAAPAFDASFDLNIALREPAVDGKLLGLASLAPEPAALAPAVEPRAGAKAAKVAPANDTEVSPDAAADELLIVEREGDDQKVVLEADEIAPEEKAEFILPPLKLLDYDAPEREPVDPMKLHAHAQKLLAKFRDFGIDGKVREVRPGPVCTTFEFVPAPGIKVSRIAALADDIAMAMEALHVRIVAPIPGKGAVGIEIPNETRETVYLKEIVADPKFRDRQGKLWMAMGKDIEGKPYSANLAEMPHVLISGTTGSGKSVSVNAMICSLLYRATPDEVKFLMIDPKMLELSIYEGIPHLLLPPITDSKKAAVALRWAVDEMERRYQALSELGVRDVEGFNEMVMAIKAGEVDKELPKQPDGKPYDKLPYIVIVVDEYADLLAVAGKDVEGYVMRLAQKARAAGLHVMLATQRPSVDVITGVIKANFPVRMGFRLASNHDSKTIVNRPGAEKLLGRGDMLIMPAGTSNLTRVHGAFISEKELHRVVEYLKEQSKPQYDESILLADAEGEGAEVGGFDEEKDARWDDAINVVQRSRKCSTSWLQRQLGIGYNRAARIVEMMEREGLVGPQLNAKGDRDINLPPWQD